MKTSEEIREDIGHRIKVRRVELKLQQKELGELMGVPQSQISGWEAGRRAMRLEQAVMLAAVLQTSVAYLVGETPARALADTAVEPAKAV
ncbi:helix-turn-helix transcriptional regulator [uncultured Thiocystis sp.]|jgi:transcriptional regulator with XRE-family HTH domain|uniref:helix-turn-helix domain-containing protein n=1 Tax=uncultured Thiocystis sp. TaxID=1202134 RepID=UPI0025F8A423|nr:helix-turn-helix transcriptional regulator [uncultured Thiocystis sp.]